MRKSGFSLAETLLGLGLISLLLVITFFAFEKGLRSWRRVDQTRDLVEGARLVVETLDKDVQRSCYSSLSCQGEALSLASAMDAQGQFRLDPQGNPLWCSYLIFYRDPQRGGLIRREQPIPTPVPAGVPIESGLGVTLVSQLGRGRLLAERIGAFELAVVGQRLDYRLRCLRPAQGHQPATPFTLEGSSQFRNR